MTVAEIREQIEDYIDQIPPEHLGSVLDFVAFLADRESEDATEELLRISGFIEAFERGKQDIAEGNFVNWRSIRRDV